MTTIEEFGDTKFEVVVTLTIGLVLLVSGVGFILRYTPPCTQDWEGTVCGPAPLYAGIIVTSMGVLLLVVGVIRRITVRRATDGLLPPRTIIK